MAKPLKVKVELSNNRGEWTAVGSFSGPVSNVDVKGKGTTVPNALRELAEAVELCFEHLQEHADG